MIGKGYLENVAAGKFTPGKTNARRMAAELLAYRATGLSPEEVGKLREAQRWVPVGERLPKQDKTGSDIVLVFTEYSQQFTAFLWSGWRSISSSGSVPLRFKVTHWRPLPEAPEPEKEGQDA